MPENDVTEDSETFTLPQIDQLILGAMRLGFVDDVAHWKSERQRIARKMMADAK